MSGLVLLLGATALVVSLPVLSRLGASQRSLDSMSHIDQQIVQLNRALSGRDPALAKLDTNAGPLDSQLTSVQGTLSAVIAEIANLRQTLQPLARQAPALGRIDLRLSAMQTELATLNGSVDSLALISGALAQLNGALAQVDGRLATVARNTRGIDTLPALIAQLVSVLQQVEQHVANIDQKTGPVLSPSVAAVPRLPAG